MGQHIAVPEILVLMEAAAARMAHAGLAPHTADRAIALQIVVPLQCVEYSVRVEKSHVG